MRTFTLDTNCIIAIEEGRAEEAAIRALIDAHTAGAAQVALVAISASERQRDGSLLETFAQFRERLSALGLGHLELLMPMFYFDVTYWDWAMWPGDDMEALERAIHKVLFQGIEFLWSDYCTARGLSLNDTSMAHRWRNAKCDVQALWSHIHHGREVFVTADKNFHAKTKKPALISLGANCIETPESALALLHGA